MPAGSVCTGSGATSQSRPSTPRSVVVSRREDSSMASPPFANRVSSSCASTSWSVGTTPYATRRSMNCRNASLATGWSNVSRVGAFGSSTMSPPDDQTNGAIRMSVGSTPRPQVATGEAPSDSPALTGMPRASRVRACAVRTRSFHVQPFVGSGTPNRWNSARL
jgi:hypothetical protein